jgi:hypothetical protein
MESLLGMLLGDRSLWALALMAKTPRRSSIASVTGAKHVRLVVSFLNSRGRRADLFVNPDYVRTFNKSLYRLIASVVGAVRVGHLLLTASEIEKK